MEKSICTTQITGVDWGWLSNFPFAGMHIMEAVLPLETNTVGIAVAAVVSMDYRRTRNEGGSGTE